MARRPAYTDADLHGPIVDGLIHRGWDVIRTVDAEPEATDDIVHFEHAVRLGRVLIANDKHMKAIAERWIAELACGCNSVKSAQRPIESGRDLRGVGAEFVFQ